MNGALWGRFSWNTARWNQGPSTPSSGPVRTVFAKVSQQGIASVYTTIQPQGVSAKITPQGLDAPFTSITPY